MVSTAATLTRPGRGRFFYIGLAVVFTVLVVWGFMPTYYRPLFTGSMELSRLLQVHGAIFSAWMLLFLAQTALVATDNRRAHMRLGLVGIVLAALMVAVGIGAALESLAVRMAAGSVEEAQRFLVLPLTDVVLFAILVTAALWNRRRPQVHKRLMVLAMLPLLPPALFRISIPYFGFNPVPPALMMAGVLALVMALDYLASRRIHPLYWIGVILVLSVPLRMMLAGTDLWLAITAPLVQWVE